MKNVPKESVRNAVIMTIMAVLFTILAAVVDVKPIGVEGTNVGFAAINSGFFSQFGENRTFYQISKFSGLICFALAGGFGVFFALQLIRRKSLSAVDRNLTILMAAYIAAALIYLLFNKFLIINYRPILRDKGLESSFPSTHAMISWLVMVAAVDQWNIYIRKEKLLTALVSASFLVLLVVLVTRTLSGVHWLTDIIGGILFGDALLAWYRAVLTRMNGKKN